MKKYYLGVSLLLSASFALSTISFAETNSSNTTETERSIISFKNEEEKNAALGRIEKTTDDYQSLETLPVIIGAFPRSTIELLKNDPNVLHIEQERQLKIAGQLDTKKEPKLSVANDEHTDWGVKETNSERAWERNITGSGIKIAIIDTGIDKQHDDLKIAGGKSFVDNVYSYDDDHGHGTHVAGIIGAQRNGRGVVGVAPNAKIYALKAMDDQGFGSNIDVIEAIDWAIANDMDIINMSFEMPFDDYQLRNAVNAANSAGITVVAAAGNHGYEPGDSVAYPARYASAIAVSSIESNLTRSDFSARGNTVDIAAPGGSITSTYPSDIEPYIPYAAMSGTSMAAPYVSGIVALIKESRPELNNTQVKTLLYQEAKDLGNPGLDTHYGHGLVQAPPYESMIVKSEIPKNVEATTKNSSVSLSWLQNKEKDVKGYNIYVDGVKKNSSLITSKKYTATGLNNKKTYKFQVTSVSINSIESGKSSPVYAIPRDNSSPSSKEIPKNLDYVLKRKSIVLSWGAVTTEISGYNIYVNGNKVNGNVYQLTNLNYYISKGSNSYMFQVSSVDNTGKESELSQPVYVEIPKAKSFKDVSNSHWAKTGIDFVSSRGWMTGSSSTEFDPEGSLSRAEAAAILVRSLDIDPAKEPSKPTFKDVPANHWAFRDIEIAAEHGLFGGVSPSKFDPNGILTREQMAVVLTRTLYSDKNYSNLSSSFKDVKRDRWSYYAISVMERENVFGGYSDGTFQPTKKTSRAEMAALMERLADFMIEKQP